MVRYVAFDAIFFLLPFLLYGAWLLLSRGSMANIEDWQAKTITYLAIAGAVVLLAVVVAFTSFNQEPPSGVYVPAHIENGVIVPGHFDPPPAK